MAEQGFAGLDFYQDSILLLKAVYRLVDTMPKYEQYNLADQLRCAGCSISLNIAEGYGRYHYLDKLRFLYIARGSLAETLSGFIIAQSIGYCEDTQLQWIREICERIEKNLNGYCRFIRSQQQGKAEYGQSSLAEQEAEYTPFARNDLLNDHRDVSISSPQSPISASQSTIPNTQSPEPL